MPSTLMMANMAEFPCVSYGIIADWDTSLCWVETYLWDPKIVLCNIWMAPKGRMALPNWMNFRKKSERPLTPLIFGVLWCNFFIMDMVEYMERGARAI